jgi:ribonuclease-3
MSITLNVDEIQRAEDMLGYRFASSELLARALTHASLADSRLHSNERLEFLGDAVLGMVICDFLFREYDHLLEGELTKIKSNVVSRRSCADLAEQMGLDRLLRLGKGMSNRGSLPTSVLSAVYEAVVGAIYVDGGIEAASAFILRGLGPMIAAAARSGHQHNFKSVLQQTAQQMLDQTPQYIVLDEKGPDHAKCFEICVEIGSRRFPSSWGASKKQAEQSAALQALIELGAATRHADDEITILCVDGIMLSNNGLAEHQD